MIVSRRAMDLSDMDSIFQSLPYLLFSACSSQFLSCICCGSYKDNAKIALHIFYGVDYRFSGVDNRLKA